MDVDNKNNYDNLITNTDKFISEEDIELLRFYHRSHPAISSMRIIMKEVEMKNKIDIIFKYVKNWKVLLWKE